MTMSAEKRKHIFDAAIYWSCLWLEFGDIHERFQNLEWAITERERVETLYL